MTVLKRGYVTLQHLLSMYLCIYALVHVCQVGLFRLKTHMEVEFLGIANN